MSKRGFITCDFPGRNTAESCANQGPVTDSSAVELPQGWGVLRLTVRDTSSGCFKDVTLHICPNHLAHLSAAGLLIPDEAWLYQQGD